MYYKKNITVNRREKIARNSHFIPLGDIRELDIQKIPKKNEQNKNSKLNISKRAILNYRKTQALDRT